MTTNHTPGPWQYVGTMNGPGLTIARDFGDACQNTLAINGCAGYVATLHTRHSGLCIRGTEAEANARLIAAAPELLAALVECAAWFELDHHRERAVMAKDTEIGRRMIEAARAAIAKAVQQ